MATLNTTNIKHASSGSNNIVLASDGKVTFPQNTGNILQVVQTFKNDVFSTTATSTEVDVTGFNVTITPSSSSNKILIMSQCGIGKSATSSVIGMQLYRDSTKIAAQATNQTYSAGACMYIYETNNLPRWVYNYLDSPNTTSAVTYQWKVKGFNSGTIYVNNRGNTDMMTTGTVIAMEVAA